MIESQRRAYLEAMNIDVWLGKPEPEDRDRLMIGPGGGSTLLLCGGADESATRLAGDINRFVGGGPVWAWPDPEGNPECPSLRDAIDAYLFTRIVVFGKSVAEMLFQGPPTQVEGSAKVVVAPGLDVLAASADARRKLWMMLS